MDYDVVVIGGGSAGCAAAHVLAAAGHSICLIEAGPDYGPLDADGWPPELLDPQRFPRTHDWGFTVENAAKWGPPEGEPRAKVVGGCSSHNQCGAVWGLPSDYDHWAEVTGDDRWRYERLRATFDQIEDSQSPPVPWRGRGGRVPTASHATTIWRRGSGSSWTPPSPTAFLSSTT